MTTWKEFALMSEEELASRDVAQVNLACAAGLPDADRIDVPRCLERLDFYARRVRQDTERLMYRFRCKPYDFHNSEAYFRVLVLITVLQRDLGVRYNPAKIPVEVPLDTADSFIHGVLFGDGGTCGSMPVVYAAVGRRLGYPIKLAEAMGPGAKHCFARWEGENGELFNIEATLELMATSSTRTMQKTRRLRGYRISEPVAGDAAQHHVAETAAR